MIGRLRGTLEIKRPPYLLIEVGGVGYELQVPMSTFYHLPEKGAMVTLLTHFYVREDTQVLFGFFEERERALFKALIKISGVGPKMALTILSGIEVSAFMQCVERKDAIPLVRLPGVGKKTAERLIIEMAGKSSKTSEEIDFSNSSLIKQEQSAEEEAMSALIALGYKPQEAAKALSKAAEQDNSSSQVLIRRALQGLARV